MRGWLALGGGLALGLTSWLGFDAGWSIALPALAGVFAMGCIYYFLAGAAVVQIFLRALLAVLPIGCLAGAIIYGLTQSGLFQASELRAVVAAVVVAGGWIVAFVTGEMRRTSMEQERRRDIARAALVEVQQILAAASSIDWESVEKTTSEHFYKNRGYEVFVMYGQQYSVLTRLVEQVEILRKPQIEPVMALYQLMDRISTSEERMSSEAFKALPWDRRQDAVLRYIKLQKRVPEAAQAAEAALLNAPFWGVLRRLV